MYAKMLLKDRSALLQVEGTLQPRLAGSTLLTQGGLSWTLGPSP